MADSDEIKRANEDLSRLLRSSIFPGAVSSFPKRSVTHSMLAEADPHNPEFKVDKSNFSQKYDLKTFMEAEFARRNLFKQVAKEAAKSS
mmetsp:Transcript_3292/g.6739  ORF Transcript_3292/g.6739 Transcript_3292/m.6739 type:complete len:89 (+) Transcript_3292:142-408(+)|eukprot:CAMPEP_0181292588 /NCGR_PEP_ID=MMETSP1101-20121128/2590_1 /TAXON_ID=46948 /ORGANISM="Rhodomonas abbreviata, Strain Caron Lab Isolate" /LENGTH=88 /DNA_ID=CAMNT_0023397075 /DNA_START=127 /DNA_END=393 /DNA_ORIENTATION=-